MTAPLSDKHVRHILELSGGKLAPSPYSSSEGRCCTNPSIWRQRGKKGHVGASKWSKTGRYEDCPLIGYVSKFAISGWCFVKR